ATVNRKSVQMPRFRFKWHPDPSLTINGGFFLFSGGNPEIYTYNSYQNPGNLLGTRTYNCSAAGNVGCSSVLTGVTGSSIPAAAKTDITTSANLGTGNANALDPNFKPPSMWKTSLSIEKRVNFADYGFLAGAGRMLGDNWRFHGDVLYERVKEGVNFVDLWE